MMIFCFHRVSSFVGQQEDRTGGTPKKHPIYVWACVNWGALDNSNNDLPFDVCIWEFGPLHIRHAAFQPLLDRVLFLLLLFFRSLLFRPNK